eukprot:3123306-Prymnesium_polylepis.1
MRGGDESQTKYVSHRYRTSRARRRKCKLQVSKECPRVITTAHVKRNHTVRFTRCVLCIDTKLAAAIISAYGSATRIPRRMSTPTGLRRFVRPLHASLRVPPSSPRLERGGEVLRHLDCRRREAIRFSLVER